MEFYTYVWRNAEGVPFYVGAGKGLRLRVLHDRSDAFKEIHARGGCDVEVVQLFDNQEDAHEHEISLIELYKRIGDGGTLVNKTAGGMGLLGYCHTDDVRAKMGAAISAAISGKPKSPAQVAAMSTARKGKTVGDERRDANTLRIRMSPARAGKYKGVCYHKHNDRWTAQIRTGERLKYLGSFPAPEDAARAYDSAAIERWGAGNCYLNFPIEVAA